MNVDLQRDPETYAIIGAAMEVHRELGYGFLEAVYQDALEVEFQGRGIQYARELSIPITYKGKPLGSPYRADFVCHGSIIVELEAVRVMANAESVQVLHYLKATGFKRALLINFGDSKLEYKRFIDSKSHQSSSVVSSEKEDRG